MSGVFWKLVLPVEWSVTPDYFVILSEADSQSILIRVANLMKSFDIELMVTCSEYKFKSNFFLKKLWYGLEATYDKTGIVLSVFNGFGRNKAIHFKLSFACFWIYWALFLNISRFNRRSAS